MAPQQTKLSVAILGATGLLGIPVVKAFLELHPDTFSRVVALTRDPTSEKAKTLEKLGAEVVQSNGPPKADKVKGIDIIINALTPIAGAEEVDAGYKVAVESGAKVYFAPEFGGDARVGNTNHVLLKGKANHARAAREASAAAGGKLKVIQLYTGPFQDFITTPFFGWDTEGSRLAVLGSSKAKFSSVSRDDIGRTLARLAILAANDPASVPDEVRISGDAISIEELAGIVGKVRGQKISVVEEAVGEVSQAEGQDMPDFVRIIRIKLGNGQADYSVENDNELVNPGQKYWKWGTVEQSVKAAKEQS